MLSHRFYYAFKPFIPWRVRMAGRRLLARYKRKTHQSSWPIDERAADRPIHWSGWPENRKFAFVITHDVEGPEGVANCRQLAELEIKLGFRSSFNFIPEGPYNVPAELRTWLTDHGFEVGVHDLNHDGKLFASKSGFITKAHRINHYLREWQAQGYRSGFMLRNLDWLHALSIQYDSSTFDTDPFEPQPDGVGTIFPYWIPSPEIPSRDEPRRSHDVGGSPTPSALNSQVSSLSSQAAESGYVELPYTLPQDSTLFLVLQERTPEIWLRKLDWIAAHSGMALVNVHPDYMDFGTTPSSRKKYCSELYAELLRQLTKQYSPHYWNPLPRELAGWFKGTRNFGQGRPIGPLAGNQSEPASSKLIEAAMKGKRVAVLLYSHYPSDPRPRRAAEAMIAAGMEVDLFSLAESDNEALDEVVEGVHVFRLPMARSRGSKRAYFWSYGRFIFSSFWFLTRQSLRRKYDLVHVHNMPDVLVFSALLLKLRGCKVLLDLHDPMPEVMMTIYSLGENRLPIRLLKLLEKWSIGFSDAVLTVNQVCQKLFSTRSCRPEKVRVIMNSPDEKIFKFREPVPWLPSATPASKPFVIMYHGTLVERHGLDLAVNALADIRQTYPHAELRVYGRETPFLRQVLNSLQSAGLQEAVHYHGPKTLEQIAVAIGECDVGIIPNRRSLFTEINTPTRIFEYLSQGKPLIAPRSQGILDYFGPEDLYYFELGDEKDLARIIREVIEHPEKVKATVIRGQAVYLNHCWSNERHQFLRQVGEVLGGKKLDTLETCEREISVIEK